MGINNPKSNPKKQVKVDNGMSAMLNSVDDFMSNFTSGREDIRNADRILGAMKTIDRGIFVSDRMIAYYDAALPTMHGQSISQPSTVARMLLLLDLPEGADVLELGTGSGWTAATLALLAYPGRTLSLEVVPELFSYASMNLEKLRSSLPDDERNKLKKFDIRCMNIFSHLDSWNESYDRILITAGIEKGEEGMVSDLAQMLLKEDGVLVCPHAFGPIIIIKKSQGAVTISETLENYEFVRLSI